MKEAEPKLPSKEDWDAERGLIKAMREVQDGSVNPVFDPELHAPEAPEEKSLVIVNYVRHYLKEHGDLTEDEAALLLAKLDVAASMHDTPDIKRLKEQLLITFGVE